MNKTTRALNKAQKERLLTYLSALEINIPKPLPMLSASKRLQDRLAQKYRNYKHAIEVVRNLVQPEKNVIISFKHKKHYNSDGENVYVHRKSRRRPLRKVPQCGQSGTLSGISA